MHFEFTKFQPEGSFQIINLLLSQYKFHVSLLGYGFTLTRGLGK